MKLPEIFVERTRQLLGAEYEAFENSLDEEPVYGLRVNTLKITVEAFLSITPFDLSPIPWVPDGFYFKPEDRPSKHPHYHAGLYYIQEPSAMSPVALMEPKPGEIVLDTCAAPGGKSCQIAALLQGKGLLITNDVSASRAQSLLHNIEICGIRNAVVVCEEPYKLAERFGPVFDRILVDAPCSGEGMFRKTEGAVKAWDAFKAESCCAMQEPILEAAHKLLKPGGVLAYSTCTFNRFENEDMVGAFMKRHPDYEPSPNLLSGVSLGLKDVEGKPTVSFYRIWPHRVQGEGHFLARICKNGENLNQLSSAQNDENPPETFLAFCKEYLPKWNESGTYMQLGEKLMLIPNHSLNLKGLRILRSGWYLGDLKKGRFEPSQAFAMGLNTEQFKHVINFQANDLELLRYLKGETIHREAPKGWNLVAVDGFPLGWAKAMNGMLKNHYPASWRKLD